MTTKKDNEKQMDLLLDASKATAKTQAAAQVADAAAPAPLTEKQAAAASKALSLKAPTIPGPLKDLVDVNFLQYASYVIKDRAIPDIADGLKPVQRRILWSLHEKDDGKFIKVANITGYCMQFHPHGDASINDALVTLANKQYLIEGQGNFGNIYTGDAAAAARYIECRLTELARKEMFNDALTEFVPSYDGRNKEPVTLPCKLPMLLMLGADGIAVGLSTRILPHNFGELLEAQIAILQGESYKILPDFQQGGRMDVSEYDKGNGKVKVRAIIDQKDAKTLIIKAIPYGTTTESVIDSIEDATRKKKIGIRSISDFTAEKIEIAITLTNDEDPEKAIQALYAFTQCEVSLSSNIVVIKDRRPVEMNVKEILEHNTKQLVDLLKRELELERKNLLDQLHAKTLVQIFIENRIYKKIEECKTYEAVQKAVLDGVNKFRSQLRRDVTTEDVEMLLEVRIKRISLFDMTKNRKDMDDIVTALGECEKNLKRLTPYAIAYLKRLLETYGPLFPRRTKVSRFDEIEVRELTAEELTMHYDKANGYYGHDVDGEPTFKCSSLDKVIFVWADGRYKMMPPPEKQFVDKNLIYAALYDRDKVMTIVYRSHGISYIKRFQFGGAIQNKDYLCTPEKSKITLLADDQPKDIFVVYEEAKGQRIHQQIFNAHDVAVKGAKTLGIQMTIKEIKNIGSTKPRNWDDTAATPAGATIKW